MRPSIFISYSHQDSGLVGPVVALLRASDALIFRDADQLQAGKKWREQLDEAISKCRILVVFWCSHSCSSDEVKKEYTAAIAQQKDVLPLLIDDTPLPSNLAEYQFIDFRAVFPHGHVAEPRLPASPSPRRGYQVLLWSGLLLALLAGVFYALYPAPPHADPYAPPPPAFGLAPWIIGAFVAFLIFLIIRRLIRGPAPYRERGSLAIATSPQQQRELADTIEHELLVRTGSAGSAVTQ